MSKPKEANTLSPMQERSGNGVESIAAPDAAKHVEPIAMISEEENPSGEVPFDPPPPQRRVSAYAVALGQLDRVSAFMDLQDDMRC